jgi:DNA-binding MarR family transcriptional regulator
VTDFPSNTDASWRSAHLGHWLRLALARFDARVMECMAQHPGVPLGLSNLAARGQVSAAHIHITRHLPTEGARLTDLARFAGMSKQAMGTLVNQCEAWGMVRREGDGDHSGHVGLGGDGRAKRVVFTETGLAWLYAYQEAVSQAEAEMRGAVGDAVATVLALGLEAYSGE